MNTPRTKLDPDRDFIRAMVAEDIATDKYRGRVETRFPPEPNGFLHIGHAKAICLNFGLAEETGGICHLRFDDTNPEKEDMKYVEAIKRDIQWLGFNWGEHLYFASDYFKRLYDYAEHLISAGKAYVDSLNEQEIRDHRGTVTESGRPSPYRERSVEENLDLFRRMRNGEFENGAHVLRAKIDMAAPNMVMRDPVLYRIRHATHYRTGDAWCIYPLYDFTHCLSDAIENITHSLCSLEFKDNRELYDWVLDAAEIARPRTEQTEFARLNVDHTVLSKRKLSQLVEGGHVTEWDDARLPTFAGMRRRGVPPEAIRKFCDMIGVAKVDSRVDVGKLEFAIRDELNLRVPRVMAVLRPLRVVIENYPDDTTEELEAPYYPHDVPKEGSRRVPFSRVIFIEREDFAEDPPKGFRRLVPGGEVRLRYAYFIKCVDVIKDPVAGDVVELRCTYDAETKGGKASDGRKVKGTVHWVSAEHSLPAEVRLYDRLFVVPNPDEPEEGKTFVDYLNPDSVATLTESRIEPSVQNDPAGSQYQFERQGYFISDVVDSSAEHLVYNRTVVLRDTWAKESREEAPRRDVRKPGEPTVGSASPSKPELTPEQAARATDLAREFGLPAGDAVVLSGNAGAMVIFRDAMKRYDEPKSVANWVMNEVLRELKGREVQDLPFGGAEVASLAALVDNNTISRRAGKEVFQQLAKNGGDPREIVKRSGLEQLKDESALEELVGKVLENNPDAVKRFRAGKTALLGFFVGQIMKESGGRADAEQAKELVLEKLT